MKFNVEVEIDWLDEGGELDAAVKKQVIDGVVGRLSDQFVSGITKDAMARVSGRVNELVTDLFNKFMDKGVSLTDSWGDTVKKNVTIENLMKDKLDRALAEKVNDSGEPRDHGNKTRLQYMIDERVRKAVETLTKSVVATVDAKIAATLNDAIRSRLSDSLLSKVDVDGITKDALSSLK